MRGMHRNVSVLLLTGLLGVSVHAQTEPNTLTDAERADGWTLLFDGTDISTHLRGFQRGDVPDHWSIEDGTLTATRGGVPLITREQWSEFEFTCEWKVEAAGNSGVMFHVKDAGRYAWETGPEMQILDNAGHGDGKHEITSAGSCYGMYPAIKDATRPVGSFNEMRIVVRKSHVEHWLNDELVCEYVLQSSDWNERFEQSKFKRRGLDDWGREGRGHIALQAHGERVWYRNLKIRSLEDEVASMLVFTRTMGFRHQSIENGVKAMREVSKKASLHMDHTEDPTWFNPHRLAKYDVVVFLNTTGDVLDDAQQEAFETFIRAGGGYVGIHSAADTEYDWPWYGKLMGAYFRSHPHIQDAMIEVRVRDHPSTEHLPRGWWRRTDEWYNYNMQPADYVTVLLSLDTSSYEGSSMEGNHPIAWCHDFDGGRALYTGGGHLPENFDEPLFRGHLLGGILWAAGVRPWAEMPVDPDAQKPQNPGRESSK